MNLVVGRGRCFVTLRDRPGYVVLKLAIFPFLNTAKVFDDRGFITMGIDEKRKFETICITVYFRRTIIKWKI